MGEKRKAKGGTCPESDSERAPLGKAAVWVLGHPRTLGLSQSVETALKEGDSHFSTAMWAYQVDV